MFAAVLICSSAATPAKTINDLLVFAAKDGAQAFNVILHYSGDMVTVVSTSEQSEGRPAIVCGAEKLALDGAAYKRILINYIKHDPSEGLKKADQITNVLFAAMKYAFPCKSH